MTKEIKKLKEKLTYLFKYENLTSQEAIKIINEFFEDERSKVYNSKILSD